MLSTKALDPRSAETAEKDEKINALETEPLENSFDELSFYLEEPDSPTLRPSDLTENLAPFSLDNEDSEVEAEITDQSTSISTSLQRTDASQSMSLRSTYPAPKAILVESELEENAIN
eukprot:CAMPEP_0176463390 /NCGR_PEP_ID=MMETSP0127-20121128/35853_1 /TAXON_ID=938130 /ORGANISM="Platyophrya macrostoma, Strain WH" /LENGTH=117 /DNA_ID=CAMNT_0017855527 /DNA_START=62 /DNA_END=414 /DNA_ORIENTATION=+